MVFGLPLDKNIMLARYLTENGYGKFDGESCFNGHTAKSIR